VQERATPLPHFIRAHGLTHMLLSLGPTASVLAGLISGEVAIAALARITSVGRHCNKLMRDAVD